MNEGGGLSAFDPATSSHGILPSSGVTWNNWINGPIVVTDGSSGYIDISAVAHLLSMGEMTVVLGLRLDAVAVAAQAIVQFRYDATNFVALGFTTSGVVRWTAQLGGVNKTLAPLNVTAGQRVVLAVTVSKTLDELRAFADGVQVGGTTTGIGTAAGTPTTGYLGKSQAGVFSAIAADYCYIYNRRLSPAQVQALYVAPFSIFPKRARWVNVPAAHSTLSANAGIYALTGNVAALVAARKITSAFGNFSLTGINAGILAARRVAAGVGSFALTGEPAALLTSRRLSAGSGIYSLAGKDAMLIAQRLLSMGSGSFSLVGINAQLTVSRLEQLGAGVFVLSGIAASLVARRIIAATPGSFALSGIDAQLYAARRLALGTGIFTLTPGDLVLVVSAPADYFAVLSFSGQRYSVRDLSGQRFNVENFSGPRYKIRSIT